MATIDEDINADIDELMEQYPPGDMSGVTARQLETPPTYGAGTSAEMALTDIANNEVAPGIRVTRTPMTPAGPEGPAPAYQQGAEMGSTAELTNPDVIGRAPQMPAGPSVGAFNRELDDNFQQYQNLMAKHGGDINKAKEELRNLHQASIENVQLRNEALDIQLNQSRAKHAEEMELQNDIVQGTRNAINDIEKDIKDTSTSPFGGLDKSLAAISVIFGAISQGLTGAKTNPAVATMNRIIDRELKSQRTRLASKQNFLSKQMAKSKTMQEAQARTELALTRDMERRLNKFASTTKGAMDMEKLNMTQSALQQRQAEAQLKLQNAIAKDKYNAKAQRAALQMAQMKASAAMQQKPKGKQLGASQAASLGNLVGMADDIERLKNKYDTAVKPDGENTDWALTRWFKDLFPGTKASDYSAMRNTLSEKILRDLTGAAAPPDEVERIKNYFAEVDDTTWSAKQKFEALKVFAEDKIPALLDTYAAAGYDVEGLRMQSKLRTRAKQIDKRRREGY